MEGGRYDIFFKRITLAARLTLGFHGTGGSCYGDLHKVIVNEIVRSANCIYLEREILYRVNRISLWV